MVENHRLDIDWINLYKREEENPYVKAWWEWWPEVRKHIEYSKNNWWRTSLAKKHMGSDEEHI